MEGGTMKFQTVVFVMFLGLAGYSSVGYSEENSSYQADAIASGKYADAEQGLQSILENNPDDPYALLNLAYVYQKSGEAAKAQQVYQRILDMKNNPYAELTSGKPEPIKNIARRGIASLESR